jgi:hypothetical protein
MPGDDKSTVRKLANALIPDAQPALIPRRLSFGFFERFRKQAGGLWVGGTVTLTPDAVSFEANGLNQALHTSLRSYAFPLAEVTRVADRLGILTRIVDVERADGSVLTFRCFGAPAFARLIAERAKQCRGR